MNDDVMAYITLQIMGIISVLMAFVAYLRNRYFVFVVSLLLFGIFEYVCIKGEKRWWI